MFKSSGKAAGLLWTETGKTLGLCADNFIFLAGLVKNYSFPQPSQSLYQPTVHSFAEFFTPVKKVFAEFCTQPIATQTKFRGII